MNLKYKRRAFTLLEIIIVIIIVGVLASLALPRFFKLIERSRQVEALSNLKAIRQALERYYMMAQSSGGGKNVFLGMKDDWSAITIDNFNQSPNAHFCYDATVMLDGPGVDKVGKIYVTAMRNSRDGGTLRGDNGDINLITLGVDLVNNHMDLCGYGYYQGLNAADGNCTENMGQDNWQGEMNKYSNFFWFQEFQVDFGCPGQ